MLYYFYIIFLLNKYNKYYILSLLYIIVCKRKIGMIRIFLCKGTRELFFFFFYPWPNALRHY